MNSIRAEKVLKNLYLIGLALMCVSIPIFNVGMSIAEIWLASLAIIYFFASSFFDLNIKSTLRNPFKNIVFLIPFALYMLHGIGLIYSSDLHYGIHDLKRKLPLIILPFVLTYLPKIERKTFNKLLWLFVAAVLFSVISSLMVYWKIVDIPYSDVRSITVKFITRISHIRLAMSVVFALAILFYFSEKSNWQNKVLAAFVSIPLIYFLLIIQSVTGMVLMLSIILFILLRKAYFSVNKLLKTFYFCAIALIVGLVVYKGVDIVKEYYRVEDNISSLPEKSALGNPYFHDLSNPILENHHYIWINIAKNELRISWNNRSDLDFDGKDKKNQELYMTILRYMTSLGLTKDAAGLSQLNDEDIDRIEQGQANAFWHKQSPFTQRANAIIFEFDNYLNGGNPSGNSVTQRLEFWKAGGRVFKKNPLFGCGTGDIDRAMTTEYQLMNSPLDSEHRLRCHNQYLTLAATLGIPGFIVFLVLVFFGFFYKKSRTNFLFLVFAIISALSFFTEDTLETQAGISFYSFFLVFLLLVKDKQNNK